MSGIAGWVGRVDDAQAVAAGLQRALQHRGPDAQGTQHFDHAALVHTYLNLRGNEAAPQIYATENKSIWAICDGAIYNHHELRRELRSHGHTLKTENDAEIIPHLYEEDGFGFVERLDGIYSLALYDTRTQTLILARDPRGVRHLFYAHIDGCMLFASEVQALVRVPGVDTSPDPQALHDLSALFYTPNPLTFYKGIRGLHAGEIMTARFENDRVWLNTRQVYQEVLVRDEHIQLDDAAVRAESLLLDALRKRIEPGVPVGAFLSGGIDSSLVSVAAQRITDGKLLTYNMKFAEAEYDETWAAEAVADHIQSDHITMALHSYPGSWDYITGLMQHVAQPFSDITYFANNLLARKIRERVKMAFSGTGADCVFGYGTVFDRLAPIEWMHWLPNSLQRGLWQGGALALEPLAQLGLIGKKYPKRFREMIEANDMVSTVEVLLRKMNHQEIDDFLQPYDYLPVRRLFEPKWEHALPESASWVEQISALATECKVRVDLASSTLYMEDTVCLREGLDVRMPMLDNDLYQFGITLPSHLQTTAEGNKIVLRALSERHLPPEVVNKPKQGFAFKMEHWVSDDFRDNLRDCLLVGHSPAAEFFRPETYQPMVEAFCTARPYPGVKGNGLARRVMIVLSTHLALTQQNQSRLENTV